MTDASLVPTAATRASARRLAGRYRTGGAEEALAELERMSPDQLRLMMVCLISEFSKRVPDAEPAEQGDRFSAKERRALHSLFNQGIRTPDTIDGEREYQRQIKAAKKNIAPDRLDARVVRRILRGEWDLPCSYAERREVIRRWREAGGAKARLEEMTGWNVSRETKRTAA